MLCLWRRFPRWLSTSEVPPAACCLWSCHRLAPTDRKHAVSTGVFITEIADPQNAPKARFVELHSPSGGLLTGLKLAHWEGGNTSYSELDLTGFGIPVGGFFVICSDKETFDRIYHPVTCDLDAGSGGPADSDGNDQLAIMDAAGAIIDVFGVPGEDGAGSAHYFGGGRAERKPGDLLAPRDSWGSFTDWDVDNDIFEGLTYSELIDINQNQGDGPQSAPSDFDPKSWIGKSPLPCRCPLDQSPHHEVLR